MLCQSIYFFFFFILRFLVCMSGWLFVCIFLSFLPSSFLSSFLIFYRVLVRRPSIFYICNLLLFSIFLPVCLSVCLSVSPWLSLQNFTLFCCFLPIFLIFSSLSFSFSCRFLFQFFVLQKRKFVKVTNSVFDGKRGRERDRERRIAEKRREEKSR